jgi:cytoskeletal protein RodZ
MATSKSLPFVFIAALILVGALAYKLFTGNDTTTVQPQKIEVSTPKLQQTTSKEKPVITIEQEEPSLKPAPYKELAELPKEDQYEVGREMAKNNMQFALRYPTAEKALEGLVILKESGNTEKLKNLVAFIQINYPNEIIPLEFLD